LAVAGKSKYGVGLGVNLHAGGFVVVERAVYAVVLVWF